MNRRSAIVLVIVVALTLAVVGIYELLPKHFERGEHITQVLAFWNQNEAFVFLNLQVTGRATNFIQEKLARSHFGAPFLLLGWNDILYKPEVVAWHLPANGELSRSSLPANTGTSGSWSLKDGGLQFAPIGNSDQPNSGFRWDGQQFVPVPAVKQKSGPKDVDTELEEDELDDRGSAYPSLIPKAEREKFRKGGWHVKALNGYEGKGKSAALPMQLGHDTATLIIRSFPLSNDAFDFGMMQIGTQQVELTSEKLGPEARTLWQQAGWKEISKSEYQELARQKSRNTRVPEVSMLWVFALLGLLIWKFVRWGNLLTSFGGSKQHVLKSLPTTYSFPPASPGQFPLLDSAALDRYTREFENLGFTCLSDFSPISDSVIQPASFCRLMVHSRSHCFAEITQFFPQRKSPLPLKCSIQSSLQEGWRIAFTDRKPQAASSLLRRAKAIAISMPGASPPELLQSFLTMRDQVCIDLGIWVLKEDTFEAYMARVRDNLGEIRETVQRKNFALGLSHIYYRRFSLLRTRPEYVWLGDYPKIAEQRKQGYAVAYGAKI